LAPERHAWWASLKHGGLLIAPARLAEHFPDEPPPLPGHLVDRLRRDLVRLDAGAHDAEAALLDVVLYRVCGLETSDGARWERGADVDTRWSIRALTGETVKPRRVWYAPNGSLLPVFVDDTTRLGIGRGRRSVSRVVHWLRAAQQKIALLTNARQWRLIYAGLDFDAWAEWDTGLWFEEGKPGPQVTALQALLSAAALTPPKPDEPSPLLAAIQASRRGQAELSSELGERVRRAVEMLIQEHGPRLEALGGQVAPRDIYVAATRMVMRMVVVLFAEARDLLPRDNPAYHASYGLQGLREILERSGGATGLERLRQRLGAWPRVLALFRLVHEGSHHQALPVPRYGGDLFAPGDPASTDAVRRALAAFEDTGRGPTPSDALVYGLLQLLCRSRVKVRQGRGSTWVEAPVDFSDLSSEYIGILYEGLLDYELHRAAEPMAFLALGDEPLLPLARLEGMDDAAIPALVEKLKVKRKAVASGEDDGDGEAEDEAEEETEDEEEGEAEAPDAAGADEPVAAAIEEADAHQAARDRARQWARRAVSVGKLVPRPRSKKPEALREHEGAVERTAAGLIERVVLPGEWFLVRWGGTRKGAGTFYTRPQLAVPTVQRTLRPLAFDPPVGPEGQPNEDAPPAAWAAKRPEEILALKVCDPAMGSGSFLVASLRFLTDALFASLHQHGRIREQGEKTLVTLAEGKPSEGRLDPELLPCRPQDDDFEPRLRARLKRYVVERCLYGVDIDPLAVELARLALWIETMDKDLPFEFLDHKLKAGNSLVGCWFDRFRDYPALAWEREGGDKGHASGVHFEKEAWTKAIKKFRNDRIKSELAAWTLGQKSLLNVIEGRTPEALHDDALAAFEAIHAAPVHDAEERARLYRERIVGNPALVRLREAFDTWCAIWFWPADRLPDAPTPRTFENPPPGTRDLVAALAQEHRFFHWELEFPDVFANPGSGFDAIVGNPPWETLQPNSREYFSNLDPLYRAYGKQEALGRQRELFEASADEEPRWLEYNARFKALSNWVKNVDEPFGDADPEHLLLGKKKADVHRLWRERRVTRRGYSDPAHSFRIQGEGKAYTYKMFLEQSHALLRPGGQLGMLVPSGIYTDKGSTALRTLFLTRCQWRWLFGFENRERIFDIHRSFKFGPVIVQKGGATEAIRTAFMRRDLGDWEDGDAHAIPYSRAQVDRFSPKTKAILEIRAQRDLEVLEKIYANSVLLGDDGPDGWGIRYAQGDFNMTSDSKLFPPRPVWEAKGYKPDEYGRWIGPDGDVALPLYQGIMVAAFDPSAKGWLSGTGLRAVWERIPFDRKRWQPQYLMSESTWAQSARCANSLKVGYREVARSTDARSFIGAVLPPFPSGHKVPLLRPSDERDEVVLAAAGLLNSLTFDWLTRTRLGAAALAWFVLEEQCLPRRALRTPLPPRVARLNLIHVAFAPHWLRQRRLLAHAPPRAWREMWAITDNERLRLRAQLDALAAALYGLDEQDLAWILRDCDYPAEILRMNDFTRLLDPKGFWRVDKQKDPELRHTVLTLAAFGDLKQAIAAHGGDRERGIEAFCSQNDGDGWMLPEALCLTDLGLGHDDRAQEPQPVRERFGPRFLPWQLEQSVEESWAECERHARNILGEEAFERLLAELRGEYPGVESVTLPMVAEGSVVAQASLFDDARASKGSEERRPGKRRTSQ